MKVTDELIKELADLACLEFTDQETKDIRNDLERMIHFVEKLNEAKTGEAEPLMNLSDRIDVYREDEVKGSVSREAALENAPDADGIYFKVPKVIRNNATE